MNLVEKKYNCCGCTVCVHICSRNAITMQTDESGFMYPQINKELCSECGLCKALCAFQNKYSSTNNLNIPLVYAAKHVLYTNRISSSSGGVFSALSDYIINRNGVVYGAAFDGRMKVQHMRAETADQSCRFRGSKYVQSDMSGIFNSIRNDLYSGRYVLFTGTSCQVAALKTYLNKDYDRLFYQDIVCHGVASPMVFESYKSYLSKKFKSDIESISFRHKYTDKVYGTTVQGMKIKFNNGTEYIGHPSEDIFLKLFINAIILRPSCFNCKYANYHKPADVTLGDFWGIQKSLPEFDDGKGVSLVLVNTEKGKELFDSAKDNLLIYISTVDDCIQPRLSSPKEKPSQYECFWKEKVNENFRYIGEKYAGINMKWRAKRIIKGIISNFTV